MNNQLPPLPSLKKLYIFVMFLFCFFNFNAQNQQDYYLEIKSGHELGTVDKTNNMDGTLSFSMDNTSFASFLSSKYLYSFKKAFPTAETPRLQRVYVITLSESASISDFSNRNEVEKIVLIDDEIILTGANDMQNPLLPNDYEDIIEGGRNVMLDLIRAPQAWTVTTGDPSILVGVADASYDLNHEDLVA